ncbi:efflux RND transporter periplasmic adaptor subunit [Nostocaceae cyanobacterium CENA369]|uniref:Efflux RND transporter periplasmic adaptor subunit n=1 Tax=Dendronalium phyllosphericum CENA369 TaxID=1725256 RepID=A0A8J7LE59_9NOST|nr:efflux RND transporter periplasmic adaptor subunit [Dendronalium phyllosphericum]MBH8572449.1 efflux RND transporter periplasmic adaptor subunit [Dendronalium phyllosphericum CENA369]
MTSPEPQTEFRDSISQTSYEPPPKKRRWLRLLIALILLIGGGGAIAWYLLAPHKTPTTANSQPQAATVKVATVQAGQIEESGIYIGRLVSRRSVTLQPRIEGQVTQIFVKSGTVVKTGDPIIQIDPREQQAAVNSIDAAAQAARSQLANAQANLRSFEADRQSFLADLKLNQQDYQRYADLAAQGAVAVQIRDQYANKLATARAAYNANEAKIKAQQASVSQAQKAVQQALANTNQQKVQLQYYRITAPFAGIVGDFPVKIGDFVNTSTQLVSVTQNRPLEVNISVPLERASQVRKGTLVQLMDAQGRNIATTRVSFISPTATNNNQTILIIALYDNARGQLQADGYVQAKVIFSQRPGVLIPTTAVARVAGENFVYVTATQKSSDGKSQLVAKQKPVKLGNITGNNYQVLEGLEPGEKIITSGLLNLRDGVPINPES